MNERKNNPACGFTLMEALLASSLLAVAVTGITMPFLAGRENQREEARKTIANGLAQELMEEILCKGFSDAGVGPEAGESQRSAYNCINDYNGYTETAGHITNNCGNVVNDPAAYGLSRNVAVSYVTVAGQGNPPTPTFACVIVYVKHGGKSILKLTRLIYQSPPPS